MDAFSNNGLLPEQIWDTEDIPEKGLYFGKHSGSGMPLTWAHSEYLKLCASISSNQVFDMPSLTRKRYLDKKNKVGFQVWRFDNPLKTLLPGNFLRIETMAAAKVIWTDYEWETDHSIQAKDTEIGIFVADIKLRNKKAKRIEFTFHWDKTDNWENKNYSVEIGKK